ncbi:sigma-70 family RNA polymerase sigma factor [Streptomyces sp. H10-C2]|uniref:RNA polymerase sigma factor n=1 Tax=unclassified Streptomyces TaxID=2593676 RepID=UPI0024B8957F|nr:MULTISPECIES: sigma-70 family RNA polymerase sigma factor [unclassified Streptomyces]MDJ0340994.1 sigma-70 family RNA polymerase sigma factor [Streptomyces sp. PH10-H1]MDJ0369774.1 sigma-70 family RNA polymerase sigma factor [Streptomyces sp. H10-C2]
MATETHPVRSGRPDGGSDERWQRMWSHREQLLKVARRRSMSVEDAEDAVHEAMLRAVESPHVEDERLGAWLTTVTMRLCVDRYRQVNREAEVRSRSALFGPGPVPVEEAVCDRAEAQWLASRSVELPARQAEALRLKSEDLDVGQVARTMGLSYEAVESLLARARRTLRNSLAGTLAAGLWLCGRGRLRGGGGGGGSTQAAAWVSTAATLVIVGLALPASHDVDRSRLPQSSASQAVGSPAAVHDSRRAPSSPVPAAAPRQPHGLGLPGGGQPSAGLLPALPQVSVPAPAVPSAPAVPPVPSVPAVPPVSAPAVVVPVDDLPGGLLPPGVTGVRLPQH